MQPAYISQTQRELRKNFKSVDQSGFKKKKKKKKCHNLRSSVFNKQ